MTGRLYSLLVLAALLVGVVLVGAIVAFQMRADQAATARANAESPYKRLALTEDALAKTEGELRRVTGELRAREGELFTATQQIATLKDMATFRRVLALCVEGR